MPKPIENCNQAARPFCFMQSGASKAHLVMSREDIGLDRRDTCTRDDCQKSTFENNS